MLFAGKILFSVNSMDFSIDAAYPVLLTHDRHLVEGPSFPGDPAHRYHLHYKCWSMHLSCRTVTSSNDKLELLDFGVLLDIR